MCWPDEKPLVPTVEVKVITESSIWLIRPDRYMRLPRHEGPRDAEYSIEGRLDDVKWHEHRGAFWFQGHTGRRIRILPTAGPEDGYGVETGVVVATQGH